MSKPKIGPYGSWKSPIRAEDIVKTSVGLGGVTADGGTVYWLEMRPGEGGRYVIVRLGADGGRTDVNAPPYSARTRVHEYGGGSFGVFDGRVLFANFADQRLYRIADGCEPRPVTPAVALRFADFDFDRTRSRLIGVREDHRGGGEAANTIVAVDPAADGDDEGRVLVAGNDFYSSPRVSSDGRHLAWLTWNHPDMPWDAAELWVAPLADDGSLGHALRVAGGPGESVCQPQWSPGPAPTLHFISDRTNWWNLYRLRDGQVEALTELAAEFAKPAWVFGQRNYAFISPVRIVCAYSQDGLDHVAWLDTAGRELTPIDVPFSTVDSLCVAGGRVHLVAGSPMSATAVVRLDGETGRFDVLRKATHLGYEEGYLSRPEPIEFDSRGGRRAYGLFYAPANADFGAPADEKPPLVVMVHGGPTSATGASQRLGVQYLTSRGIAVVDVNYGGSSGYGRAYRESLHGQWGIVDVEDCCAAATSLAAKGRVDGRRMAITGASAGGYATLAALAFHDVFAAGASLCGVSDCEALAVETHKFESRYLDKLIGPYPERRDLYLQRSPLHHVDGIGAPVLFLQGLEDEIVPPSQAERMVDALRKRGVPVAYLPFEGEQHGLRKADNIRRAMEAELYFFSRVFGFDLADPVEPVAIENL